MKAVEDPRIDDLRSLVAGAVAGEVEFDHAFAKATLSEVLKVDSIANKWRKITSYIALPFGLIPWVGGVAQKLVEETAGGLIDYSLKKEFRWYYLLSNVADSKDEET